MTIFSSREGISIYPPHDVPMKACVGTTAIFPQLLSSRSSLLAALSRRRLRGEGLEPCSSPGQHRPVLLPGAPSRAPQGAGSRLQCRLKPALLPRDSWLVHAGLRGAQQQQLNTQVISLPAPTILVVGCRLRLDGQLVRSTSSGQATAAAKSFPTRLLTAALTQET